MNSSASWRPTIQKASRHARACRWGRPRWRPCPRRTPLAHDPTDPARPDRDRFVLSAGHGSMLLYAWLHLTGYDLPLGEIQHFRQWGSHTPGHPEFG